MPMRNKSNHPWTEIKTSHVGLANTASSCRWARPVPGFCCSLGQLLKCLCYTTCPAGWHLATHHAFGCFLMFLNASKGWLPVYFHPWTQVLLYIKLLQSGFKCARVCATEVPAMVGKDIFKYSWSPGSGVTKPWYFKSLSPVQSWQTHKTSPSVCVSCMWLEAFLPVLWQTKQTQFLRFGYAL